MAYILNRDRPNNSLEEWEAGWKAYCDYLKSVEDRLPGAAYEFATADWHYDFSDHRAPHDGWLESVVVSEPASGDRKQHRTVEINVRLLAAYHDGHIELTYSDVQSYSLGCPESSGHGDWLYDEVRLSEREYVLHEIEWSSGGLWKIESGDVIYKWLPFER